MSWEALLFFGIIGVRASWDEFCSLKVFEVDMTSFLCSGLDLEMNDDADDKFGFLSNFWARMSSA